MKHLILALLLLLVPVRADDPPKPFSITLPSLDADKSAKLTALVNDLLAHARASDARLHEEDTILKDTEQKEATEEAMVQEVQKKIDKDEALIVKQKEQLRRWLIFGRTMLLLIFALGFSVAWHFTAMLIVMWWRIAACCVAGAAFSTLTFWIITRLL